MASDPATGCIWPLEQVDVRDEREEDEWRELLSTPSDVVVTIPPPLQRERFY